MAVEWPITPIIDQSPISRLCNCFTAARKKTGSAKGSSSKMAEKKERNGARKKNQNGQSQKN